MANTLPPADRLVAIARQALQRGATLEQASRELDRYAPGIDAEVPAAAAAAWLGITPAAIYRDRNRTDATGRARWPQPDTTRPGPAGRPRGYWRYRTLVLHRASMPGRGSTGRGRPAPGASRPGKPGRGYAPASPATAQNAG